MRISTVFTVRPRKPNAAAVPPRRPGTVPLIGGFLLLVPMTAPAEAQLLRGTLNTSGNGILGTGLNVGTTGGGVLGTGLTVGTTGPGDGLLGTGLTLGTAGTGGTGNCTSCDSGGGTTGGTGQSVYVMTGNVTQSQSQSQMAVPDLRLTQLSNITAISTNNTSGLAGPVAAGGDSIAVGYGGSASGVSSTAVGTSASAGNTGSVAVGNLASAQGVGSTAVGTAASASADGSTAYGFVAGATGTGSTAIGAAASAAGANSVALGNGAAANQANTIAIGANVRTSQANQVAIGNAANTYTLAGIASQASAAAQSGATNFVTTDAGGNLAASAYGPSAIAGLGNRLDSAELRLGAVESRVTSLEAQGDALRRYAVETRREARQGVAMAIAMATAPMPSAPGKTTWATNGATFRGEVAGGLAVAHRLPTCCVPIAITAGVAYSGDSNVGVRAGLAGEF